MATPSTFLPLAASTPLSHLGGVSLSYSKQIHPVLSSRDHMQSHRQRIVKEIFDTEHTYISQLNTIVTLFLKPIRVGCLLPTDVITMLFSNIEAILSVNKELFSCMRQQSLGEAFTYLAPFLKLYSTYANNFQTATHTLQELLKHSAEFASFVVSQESRPECCGLALSALLITPIQRIPRYKLLLEEVLKYTKRTHPDYDRLNDASIQIAEVTYHINEYIRHHETFKKMLSIQNSLTGNCVPSILVPGRNFIQEGRLMKVCRRKAKERVVFLFSDVLIYARPNFIEKKEIHDRTYEFRCVFPLLNSTIHILRGDHRAPGIELLFQIYNGDTSLIFFSSKKEDVLHWKQTIEDVTMKLKAAYGSLMNSQKVSTSSKDYLDDKLSPQSHNPSLTPTCTTLCTPYPLTATIFSTDFSEDAEGTSKVKKTVAKTFSYEPDVVNAIMNGSRPKHKSSDTQRNEESSELNGVEHPTSGRGGTASTIDTATATVLTNKHALNETERPLAQQSGLVQVASCSTISSMYSVGGRYSRCCTVM